MSLLTMVEEMSRENGYSAPSTVIDNSDLNVVRMLAHINMAGKELADRYDWAVLTKEHTFATVADTQAYSLPSDFSRFKGSTLWDRTNTQSYGGPLSSEDWQKINSGNWVLNKEPSFMVRAVSAVNKFHIEPTPDTNSETQVYEYITNQWVQLASGQSTSFAKSGDTTADTNTSLIDEELVKLWASATFLESLGLPFVASQKRAEDRALRVVGRDGGAPRLNMGSSYPESVIMGADAKDQGYGATS